MSDVSKQIVVKETKAVRGSRSITVNTPGGDTIQNIPTEAVIMQQLNQWNNPNILRLRSYKRYLSADTIDPDNPDHRDPADLRNRFYVEYCPHGDLLVLRNRYRHFSHFFPELWIWHVFDSLINAAQDFKHRPYISNRGLNPADNEVVHYDIKSQNSKHDISDLRHRTDPPF